MAVDHIRLEVVRSPLLVENMHLNKMVNAKKELAVGANGLSPSEFLNI